MGAEGRLWLTYQLTSICPSRYCVRLVPGSAVNSTSTEGFALPYRRSEGLLIWKVYSTHRLGTHRTQDQPLCAMQSSENPFEPTP